MKEQFYLGSIVYDKTYPRSTILYIKKQIDESKVLCVSESDWSESIHDFKNLKKAYVDERNANQIFISEAHFIRSKNILAESIAQPSLLSEGMTPQFDKVLKASTLLKSQPNVPIEKKIEFLRSHGYSEEEINQAKQGMEEASYDDVPKEDPKPDPAKIVKAEDVSTYEDLPKEEKPDPAKVVKEGEANIKDPMSIVRAYNEISNSMTQDDWNDDFMFAKMELAPGNQIRFSWKMFTGPELGTEERSKYLTPEEALKELQNIQGSMEEDTTDKTRLSMNKKPEMDEKSTEPSQEELDKIKSWLSDTTEEFDDWDWDGNELVVFLNGEPIERYSRKDLQDANVFEYVEQDPVNSQAMSQEGFYEDQGKSRLGGTPARKNMKCPECGSNEQDRYEDGDTYCKKCGALIGYTTKKKESVYEDLKSLVGESIIDQLKKVKIYEGMDYIEPMVVQVLFKRIVDGKIKKADIDHTVDYISKVFGDNPKDVRDKVESILYDEKVLVVPDLELWRDDPKNLPPIEEDQSVIKAAVYHWGEYREDTDIYAAELENMEQLASEDLLGFTIRPEDEGKKFYAYKEDIERTEAEGTGVKNSFAVENREPMGYPDEPVQEGEWGVHTSDGKKVKEMKPIPEMPGEWGVKKASDEDVIATNHSAWSWEYDNKDVDAKLSKDAQGNLFLKITETIRKTGLGAGEWSKDVVNEPVGTVTAPRLSYIRSLLKQHSVERSRAGYPFPKLWADKNGEKKTLGEILGNPSLEEDVSEERPCPCGSELPSTWQTDKNGIPLARTCKKCHDTKMKKYRPDVLKNEEQSEEMPQSPKEAFEEVNPTEFGNEPEEKEAPSELTHKAVTSFNQIAPLRREWEQVLKRDESIQMFVDKIKEIEDKVWQNLGIKGATRLEDPEMALQYKVAMKMRLEKLGIKPAGIYGGLFFSFENENYHTLNQFLLDNGYFFVLDVNKLSEAEGTDAKQLAQKLMKGDENKFASLGAAALIGILAFKLGKKFIKSIGPEIPELKENLVKGKFLVQGSMKNMAFGKHFDSAEEADEWILKNKPEKYTMFRLGISASPVHIELAPDKYTLLKSNEPYWQKQEVKEAIDFAMPTPQKEKDIEEATPAIYPKIYRYKGRRIKIYKDMGSWTWKLMNSPNSWGPGQGPTYNETPAEALKDAKANLDMPMDETAESPGPEHCEKCKAHIGTLVAQNFDGMCPDCWEAGRTAGAINEQSDHDYALAGKLVDFYDKEGKSGPIDDNLVLQWADREAINLGSKAPLIKKLANEILSADKTKLEEEIRQNCPECGGEIDPKHGVCFDCGYDPKTRGGPETPEELRETDDDEREDYSDVGMNRPSGTGWELTDVVVGNRHFNVTLDADIEYKDTSFSHEFGVQKGGHYYVKDYTITGIVEFDDDGNEIKTWNEKDLQQDLMASGQLEAWNDEVSDALAREQSMKLNEKDFKKLAGEDIGRLNEEDDFNTWLTKNRSGLEDDYEQYVTGQEAEEGSGVVSFMSWAKDTYEMLKKHQSLTETDQAGVIAPNEKVTIAGVPQQDQMAGFNNKQGTVTKVEPDGITVKFTDGKDAKFMQPSYLKKMGAAPQATNTTMQTSLNEMRQETYDALKKKFTTSWASNKYSFTSMNAVDTRIQKKALAFVEKLVQFGVNLDKIMTNDWDSSPVIIVYVDGKEFRRFSDFDLKRALRTTGMKTPKVEAMFKKFESMREDTKSYSYVKDRIKTIEDYLAGKIKNITVGYGFDNVKDELVSLKSRAGKSESMRGDAGTEPPKIAGGQTIREVAPAAVKKERPAFTKDYTIVADDARLMGKSKENYVKYMTARWPTGEAYYYAMEWARRFKYGDEWANSDLTGRSVLKKLGYTDEVEEDFKKLAGIKEPWREVRSKENTYCSECGKPINASDTTTGLCDDCIEKQNVSEKNDAVDWEYKSEITGGLDRDYVEDINTVLTKIFGNEYQYGGRNTGKLTVISANPPDTAVVAKFNKEAGKERIILKSLNEKDKFNNQEMLKQLKNQPAFKKAETVKVSDLKKFTDLKKKGKI